MSDQLKRNLLARTLIGLLILIGVTTVQFIDTSAQSGSEGWALPINLSNSGSTSNPQLVVDSSGIHHVLWKDDFEGYVYTQSTDGAQWSSPVPLSFPFLVEDSTPLLLPDSNGYIHAFWTDVENVLYYSRVVGVEVGNPASWQGARSLAESALDFDAIIDSTGIIHLSYVRQLSSEQFPSGIYHRKSADGGQNWTIATPLYQSKYFRPLEPKDAHVQISSTNVNGEEHIYVAWDNRPIKRSFLTKSFDAGESWSSTTEIDGPSDDTITIAPFNVVIQPDKENVLVVWQSGLQSGFDCNQYFKWSNDRGNTWSERQLMLENLVGCPTENKIFQTPDGTIVLWTIIQEQVYLLAWNGTVWSDIFDQSEINSFTNPDTFEGVNFRCRQPVLGLDGRLLVVGCDTVGTRDIWFTENKLPSFSYWFPAADLWSTPKFVTSTYEINNLQSVFDSEENLHAFWSQLDNNTGQSKYSIYYAQYGNNSWSQPVKILSTPGKHSEKPSIAYDRSDRLMVAWESSETGEILFSWARASSAINPFEWSNPISLPTSFPKASSPDIIIDNSGNIVVAYSVKINENRGIYMSKSSDGGSTWDQPVSIFNAVAAGLEIVDEPHLTHTDNGDLYVIWKGYPSTEANAQGLYYSKSEDGGNTWAPHEVVTDQNISDVKILGVGLQTVHRFWIEEENGVANLWHQFSSDRGENWSVPETLTSFGEIPGPFSIASDQSGQIYLVEVVEGIDKNLFLNFFIWNLEEWIHEEGFNIGKSNETIISSIAADLSLTGKLAVQYSQNTLASQSEVSESLNFSKRSVLLPISISTPNIESTISSTEANSTQELISTQEPSSTVTPTSTQKTEVAIEAQGNPPNPISLSNYLGLVVAGTLSVLLVGTIFTIGVIKIIRRN